ncbi:hypothetical protein [Micavibrio aeruginosavorus]|uniref:Lipoprotein n=1 Tax=Micavibrio aeruginosavorus EPB TaxID=349215 RepID=M4VFM6_9BACT|nr:hypothetical protein [Micavibrio aeruginosavorus]AGH98177.1 hypothetical protein A11S_1368 [Micavibrio aeruginosavorus EPB]
MNALSKKFAGLTLGPLLLTGCFQSPTDYVREEYDPTASCAQTESAALNKIRTLSGQSALLNDFQKSLRSQDLVLCQADLKSGASHALHSWRDILVINRNSTPDKVIATELYKQMFDHDVSTSKQSDRERRAAESAKKNELSLSHPQRLWSAFLVPEDALAFSRLLDAHALTSFVSHVQKHYGEHSEVWSTLSQTKRNALDETMIAFKTALDDGKSFEEAQKISFKTALTGRINDTRKDAEFLTWYANQLKPHEELSMSLCYDFQDGSMDPCITSKTIYPSVNLGKQTLSAESVIEISKLFSANGNGYLNDQDARDILQHANEGQPTQNLTTLNNTLKDCCDGSKRGGTFGFSSKGRIGFSLF